MKKTKFEVFILIAMLISAFCVSQNLQPKPIEYENEKGLFVSIDLMDTISLKLIDRASLKSEVLILKDITKTQSLKIEELGAVIVLHKSNTNKYRNLWQITEKQKNKALEGLEAQEIITRNVKKKAFKNGLLCFGGGVSVGLVAFIILAN